MKRSLALTATAYLVALVVTTTAQPVANKNSATGMEIFRFDTFGDEQLWTDTLRMHEALATVTPALALKVGLKVDSEALPPPVVKALKSGQLDVNDPKVTRQLLEMNAVVGISAKIAGDQIRTVGVTCALCHSTVDNSLGPGIGQRLDGWPNLDLNVGAILGLSPALGQGLKEEFGKWGAGKYDPRHHAFDGTLIVDLNSPSIPVVIPPAYGLQGVGFETFTGDGPISYWNSYVGVGQMGGQGNFSDPRIGLSIVQQPDRVTKKLPELLAYQLSLTTPPAPAGSFDVVAAGKGQQLFNGVARCGTCHVPPMYTDVMNGPNANAPLLHPATEIGANAEYAERSATFAVSRVPMYRTTPLRALWQHPPYFHDGRAATLLAVVDHYDALFTLGLTAAQKADLVEFLKSL